MSKFPASVPRKMYWSDEVGGHSRCPQCNGPLESEHHPYLIVVPHGGEGEQLMAGTDGGYFCTQCRVVVLDHDLFKELAAIGTYRRGKVECVVVGVVDMDAVPRGKRHLP